MTKLQFSKLFHNAWIKAIHPSNVISGFRKTGICPLDSTAIKISAPSEKKSESPSEMEFDPTENAESDSSDSLCNVQLPLPVFSAEQFELFNHRYENGYNLYNDQDYVAWLQQYHPDSLPDDLKPEAQEKLLQTEVLDNPYSCFDSPGWSRLIEESEEDAPVETAMDEMEDAPVETSCHAAMTWSQRRFYTWKIPSTNGTAKCQSVL